MSPLDFYKCLSEETRLKTLLLIAVHGELCVCDLQQVLGQSQPKVSRHLAELRKHQLLMDERRAKWVYYRLHPELPSWAKTVLLDTAANNPEFLPVLSQQAQSCCVK